MFDGSASQASQAAVQYRTAIDAYRSIAKWVISSFGAVAAALVVGVQLTSLGELHGWRLHLAFVSVAVVFGCVLTIMAVASRLLVPLRVNYRGFAKGREFGPLRKALKQDNSDLENEADTAAALAEKFETLRSELRATRRKHEEDSSAITEQAVKDAEQDVAIVYEHVMRISWLGRFLRTKQIYRQTMAVLYVAVVIAAAGAIGFAYFSSPPAEDPSSKHAQVHVTVGGPRLLDWPRSCARLYFALDKLAAAEPRVGPLWPAGSLSKWDRTCGLRSKGDVERALEFLGRR